MSLSTHLQVTDGAHVRNTTRTKNTLGLWNTRPSIKRVTYVVRSCPSSRIKVEECKNLVMIDQGIYMIIVYLYTYSSGSQI